MPETKGSKSKSKVDGEGLIEDRDSDSEFDPEEAKKQINAQQWDDEENLVVEGEAEGNDDVENEEESEQEMNE